MQQAMPHGREVSDQRERERCHSGLSSHTFVSTHTMTNQRESANTMPTHTYTAEQAKGKHRSVLNLVFQNTQLPRNISL